MAYGISLDNGVSSADRDLIPSMDRAWGPSFKLRDSFKSAGNSINIDTPGAANAKYGPYMFMLPYIQHNALAVMGQKPYESGRRVQMSLSLSSSTSAGTVRNGYLTTPEIGTYAQILEPYKLYSLTRTMPLGVAKLGEDGRDDLVDWDNFLKNEATTLVVNEDQDVLRRIEDAPIVGLGSVPMGSGTSITSTERVGFESIERIISNATEAAFLPDTYAIPWYNSTSTFSGSGTNLAAYRGQTGTTASMIDSYVDANYTPETTTGAATLRPLTLDMIDAAIFATMPYWGTGDNKLNNKAIVTGYDTIQKISGMSSGMQRFFGWEGLNLTVNGINTVPGRQTGVMANTYQGVPLIPDYNVNRGTVAAPTSGIGRMYGIDQDSLFVGPLMQPRVTTSDNAIMNQSVNRMAVFDYHAEVQAVKFKSLFKIIHCE